MKDVREGMSSGLKVIRHQVIRYVYRVGDLIKTDLATILTRFFFSHHANKHLRLAN